MGFSLTTRFEANKEEGKDYCNKRSSESSWYLWRHLRNRAISSSMFSLFVLSFSFMW